MRYHVLLGIITMILIAGCVSPPSTGPEGPSEPEKQCRMVEEEVPVLVDQCTEVSYTEEVCERRELEYTVAQIPTIHLCVADGGCVGRPLSECVAICEKAMTRCTLAITNNDNKSGEWTVDATFTVREANFVKNPNTQTVDPGETIAFDFQQIYIPEKPITSATCNISVTDTPIIDDCHDETRMVEECEELTKYTTVQKEVCE